MLVYFILCGKKSQYVFGSYRFYFYGWPKKKDAGKGPGRQVLFDRAWQTG
jgi:hypothetical protein